MDNKHVSLPEVDHSMCQKKHTSKTLLYKYVFGFFLLLVLLILSFWFMKKERGISSPSMGLALIIILGLSVLISLGVLSYLLLTKEDIIEKKKVDIFDMTHFLIMVIGIVFFIQVFMFTITTVEGQSMESTLHENDRVLVYQLIYKYDRNHVVVMRADKYSNNDTKDFYVKRIKGLPGDDIRYEYGLDDEGKNVLNIYINEILAFFVNDDDKELMWKQLIDYSNHIIPDEQYVLIGDYHISYDSKHFGFVQRADILGKVTFRFYKEIGFVK